MTAPQSTLSALEPKTVPLPDVESEVSRQLQAAQGGRQGPGLSARMSNLVIYCEGPDRAREVDAEIAAIVNVHPARVLLLDADPKAGSESDELSAIVEVHGHRAGEGRRVFSEQITIHAPGRAAERLPYIARSLVIGDLPTNLWWASRQPPPLAGPILSDLAEHAQQIVYDSNGWADPIRGIAAAAPWLAKVDRGDGHPGAWRVASDLNWRRLKIWRRLLGQALDPTTAPGALGSISEVVVEHGPHSVAQAWELVGWLASRLKWKVQASRLQPNVEIAWQVRSPTGTLRVRIDRLPEGPSELHRVKFTCAIEGRLGALDVSVEDGRRLAVRPEGFPGSPRTVTLPPQPLADLVGRQLSDRERDPVFKESMDVAQVFAQSLTH